MSLHKIKPKLKKYKKAGLFKSKKDSTAQARFFLPERTHLNLYLKKLENTYTNSLVNRRRIKLLLGFSQIHKLNNFIKQAQRKRRSKWRFSKSISLVSLIERRLDIILFRVGFASTLSQARQLIGHQTVLVNGVFVTSSFFLLKKGDVISFSPKVKIPLVANIERSVVQREKFISSFHHVEVNLSILKIILVEENLKTKECFHSFMSKQEWNLLFSK